MGALTVVWHSVVASVAVKRSWVSVSQAARAPEKLPENPRGIADKRYMDVSAIALGGMTQAQDRLDTTARRLASDPVDTLDLSAEMLALIEARNQFAANAKVAETGDRMERSVLNILA